MLVTGLVAVGAPIGPAAREIRPAAVSDNPLVAPWTGAHGGLPPWDQLQPGLFPAAFDIAMAEERREIDAIVSNPDAPTFDNTIAAMERAGGTRERVSMLLDVAQMNVSTPEVGLGVENGPGVLVPELLPELREQRRHFLVDPGKPLLVLAIQRGAAPDIQLVEARREPPLIGREIRSRQ